jgi:signal transduction histidine kinase
MASNLFLESAPASERIFELFARAANSRQPSEGAGLGLATVRAIVEAHGGRVELESQLGKGSTFRFAVPVKPPFEAVGSGDWAVGMLCIPVLLPRLRLRTS